MQASHAKDIENIEATTKQDFGGQLQILMSEHAENLKTLESDLTEAREDVMKVATQVAFALGMDVSVEKITECIDDLVADQKALSGEQRKNAELTTISESALRDKEAVKAEVASILQAKDGHVRSQRPSVVEHMVLVKRKVDDLEVKNKKNSRLVDELEEQKPRHWVFSPDCKAHFRYSSYWRVCWDAPCPIPCRSIRMSADTSAA